MRVHLYTFTWNEEYILPYFLAHYSPWVERIVIHDNESTDRTVEIASAHPKVEVRTYRTSGRHSEHLDMVPIRNECWKESRGLADFVAIVDADEFLFHHDMAGFLAKARERRVTLVRSCGWEMVSEERPEDYSRPLTELVRTGVQSHIYSKPCLLDPDAIESVAFAHGAHGCEARGDVNYLGSGSLKMLHYKRLGWEAYWARTVQLRNRSHVADVGQGHFSHYRWSFEEHRKVFVDMLRHSVDVTT